MRDGNLDGLVVIDGRKGLNYLNVLDRLEVLDGDNVLESTRLEVYNQLLSNGLADPLGIKLLEL